MHSETVANPFFFLGNEIEEMSARPVVKTSHMPAAMQEFAIMAAQVNKMSIFFDS